MDNRYILEMIGRHRFEEIQRDADKNRLRKEAERSSGKEEKPLWKRVVTWVAGTAQVVAAAGGGSSVSDSGGRMANAAGAGEVPGL